MNWVYNLLLGLCLVMVIVLTLKVFQPKENAKEKIANTKRLLENLIPSAIMLISEVEIKFGASIGFFGRAYILDGLYKLIPDEYKKYVTEKNLEVILSKAFRIVCDDHTEDNES